MCVFNGCKLVCRRRWGLRGLNIGCENVWGEIGGDGKGEGLIKWGDEGGCEGGGWNVGGD